MCEVKESEKLERERERVSEDYKRERERGERERERERFIWESCNKADRVGGRARAGGGLGAAAPGPKGARVLDVATNPFCSIP